MRPVGSKYLLEEPLGRGATGTVFRARQRETAGAEAAVAGQPGETVAIKVLREELASDPDVVMRFLRERSVLLRLQHRNIVRTRDLVVEGDLLALVMDLVDGPDLDRYLRDNGPLSPAGAALAVAQVSDALAVSHADGVVHRDLKPANVLLAGNEEEGMRPMLTDFGIARLADSPGLTRTEEFVGTPAYVAPESAAGRPQTSAVDIYGAGILLYELLTGRPPFGGGTALEVLRRHLDEDPQRPEGVPDPLWTVLERCLRKNPEERPGAENLARALRTVANGVGAHATGEQAAAALGVGALLAPDPAPASVPGTGTGLHDIHPGSAAQQGTYDPEGATTHMPQNPGPPDGGQDHGPDGGGQDPDATHVIRPAAGQGPNPDAEPTRAMPPVPGRGPDADPTQAMPPVPGGGPNADPTQVMPPVPGGFPQDGQDGPHPWETQMRAARDRNEATQVQPLDPELDPMRRRPHRQPAAPPPQYRQDAQQYPPEQYAPQQYAPEPPRRPEPQRRRPEPPPRRREAERPREPEPPRRERRERRGSANPMHIPGLGCLKGCLFMIIVIVVIAVLLWNFTPLPEWWTEVRNFWDGAERFFGKIGDLVGGLG